MTRSLEIRPGFESLVGRLGLSDPARAPSFETGELVSESSGGRVFRFREPSADGDLYYFKVYYRFRLRRRFTYLYRRSRAYTEFQSLCYLRRHDLPAPEPVAWGSHRTLGVARSCFLLTRGVEHVQDLETFLPGFFAEPRTAGWRGRRDAGLASLADLVGRMHGADFFDHDLHYRNLLLSFPPQADEPSWWLIDHPKARILPPGHGARRQALVHDLACLDKHASVWITRPQRLRWFLRYRGVPRVTADDRKLLAEIAAHRDRAMGKRELKLARQ